MNWTRVKTLGYVALCAVVAGLLVAAFTGRDGETAARSESGRTVLRYMVWGKENEIQELAGALEDFERDNPDIHVELVHTTGMYQIKLATMLAGGVAPDVFMLHEAMFPALAERKLLLPLDELIENDPDLSAFREQYLPEVIEMCRYQPRWSDKPLFFQVPAAFNVVLIYLNKDLFDAAGVPYPRDDWTWDDFLDKAKRLTRRDKNGRITQYGCMSVGPWLSNLMVMWDYGGEVFDNRGHFVAGRPEFIERNARALQFCADLVHRHRVQPSLALLESLPNNLFMAGRVAMQLSGTWLNNQLRGFDQFRWDLAPPPRGTRRTTLVFGGSPVIFSRTPHRKEAWRLLKFFLSDRWQRVVMANARGAPAKVTLARSMRVPGIPKAVRLDLITQVLPDARPQPSGLAIAELMEQRLGPLRDRVMLGSIAGPQVRAALEGLQRTVDEACPYCAALR